MHDTRRTRMVLAVLLAVALALIALDYLGWSGPLRAMGGTVFGTAERAANSVIGPVAGFFERGAGTAGSTSRVRALERQLITLRFRLSQQRLSETEYAQLARLLRLSGSGGYRIVAANVIAVSQGYGQAITLDVGSSNGVRPDETVLNGAGLVGTVASVSQWTSTVLLETDSTAVTGVRLAGSGRMGWVTGAGEGIPRLESLRLHLLGAPSGVSPGQRLVTSASIGDRPYVSGIPVGAVTRVVSGQGGLTATALVRPFVDVAALDVVAVVVGLPSGRRGPGSAG